MLETAADNASILSIDLGLLIGLLVLLGLLDPSLGRDLILFGTTVASLLIVYVCVALARHPFRHSRFPRRTSGSICSLPSKFSQHRQLVVRLFGSPSGTVAHTANLGGAISSTIARGFRSG